MLRWVKVEEVGDTDFLIDEQVDKFVFQEENRKAVEKGGKAGQGPSAAPGDHQERPQHGQLPLGRLLPGDDRVLTEASMFGKIDYLRSLKRTSSWPA